MTWSPGFLRAEGIWKAIDLVNGHTLTELGEISPRA